MGDSIADLWEQPSNEETFSDLGMRGTFPSVISLSK